MTAVDVSEVARVDALVAGLRERGLWPLVEIVLREHRVSPLALLGRSRRAAPSFARHHLAALIRWSTWISYPDIGDLIGRDHTTVIASVAVYERHLEARFARLAKAAPARAERGAA